MLRKLLISIIGLVVLGLAAVVLVANFASNPYGLEPERLGPRADEKLPQITPIPNAKNYLLYPAYDENAYVIHLALPNHYIHESNASTLVAKSYSVFASMYYPDLNGKFHPDNANLPSCNGYCDGYMSAFIEPSQVDARTMTARRLEYVSRDRLQDNPLRLIEDLTPEFGINEHFQLRYPIVEEKSGGDLNSTDEFFVVRSEDGEVKYLFECTPYTATPGCGVKFNLSARPELVVDIKFGRHLMTEWERIIQAADEKIGSWNPVRIESIAN